MFLTRRHIITLLFCAVPLLVTPMPPAAAAADSAAADREVAACAEAMWQNLAADDLGEAERRDRLASTIAESTDTALLGRLALGRHWRTLSDEQQTRYSELFPAFITHLLAARLIGATGKIEGGFDDMFEITGAENASDEDVIVHSEITRAGNQPPVAVDWRLRDDGDGLAIIDLAIDQVSLLVSQRSEFAAVIERGSIDDLLQQLENGPKAES